MAWPNADSFLESLAANYWSWQFQERLAAPDKSFRPRVHDYLHKVLYWICGWSCWPPGTWPRRRGKGRGVAHKGKRLIEKHPNPDSEYALRSSVITRNAPKLGRCYRDDILKKKKLRLKLQSIAALQRHNPHIRLRTDSIIALLSCLSSSNKGPSLIQRPFDLSPLKFHSRGPTGPIPSAGALGAISLGRTLELAFLRNEITSKAHFIRLNFVWWTFRTINKQ